MNVDDQGRPDATDTEERRDDEELDEFFATTWKANVKEGFDIFRGDERASHRIFLNEYVRGIRSQERAAEEERGARMRRQEELHMQALRHAEELFHLRTKQAEEEYSERRRQTNLASTQQWRDQARDSGESAFKPETSS